MTISFTVREVTADALVVDYGDGSWAQVPLRGSPKKSDILKMIVAWNPGGSPFASAGEVPFAVGESGELQTPQEEADAAKAAADAELLDYSFVRQLSYPALGDQLDALYWSRQGDDTKQQAIDTAIAEVKATYPKDMTPITRAEYQAILDAASQ